MANSDRMKPRRPTNIPAYAEICLQALVANGLSDKVSLGGAFGLLYFDSFPDLLASKMIALVERGAPRDFRDIYALCRAGLATPHECWQVWRQRQQLAGSDTDIHRARLALETHLTRIALHRPLDDIPDPVERADAEQVRNWFGEEFLDALVD